MNAIAWDENVRNPPTIAGGESDGKADRPPHRSPFPLSQEIPDIFIPPTQNGNAGVTSGRNENSGMTTGGIFRGGGSFRSGIQSPTGAGSGNACESHFCLDGAGPRVVVRLAQIVLPVERLEVFQPVPTASCDRHIVVDVPSVLG